MDDNPTNAAPDLRLVSLALRDFRNYEHARLEGFGDLSILVGENAVGKTNAVEAIQLVTALKSFRASHAEQLVRNGAPGAVVEGTFENSRRRLDIQLVVDDTGKRYSLNGNPKRIRDLKGLVPAVAFTPDDLDMVKGSNTRRRTSLDDLGSQLSNNYHAIRSDYQKIIRQKSAALKDGQDSAFIRSINEVVAKVGAQFYIHRTMVCEKLLPYLETYYKTISNGRETLQMSYVPTWGNAETITTKEQAWEQLSDRLEKELEEELARKRCVVGPHADTVVFSLDGQDAIHYASQGQQRSIVLAFKMSEACVIRDICAQNPLLLLDDVMSELDEHRRRSFVEFLEGRTQTFITTTNLAYFDPSVVEKATVFEMPLGQETA